MRESSCRFISAILVVLVSSLCLADAMVGPQEAGSHRVATGQIVRPAGESLVFPGRPVDMIFSPDHKTLYAKHNKGIVTIDLPTWKIRLSGALPSGIGASACGMAIRRDGSRLYSTTADKRILEFAATADGLLAGSRIITVPGPDAKGNSNPLGIALSPDEKTAYVCLSINNTLAVVDLEQGNVTAEIPVGMVPYAVVLAPDARLAYVSNWGGRRPTAADRTANSAGSQIVVDARSSASSGCVSVVDLVQGKEIAQIPVGLHPSAMCLSPDGSRLYVANSTSDSISVIDSPSAKPAVQSIPLSPQNALFGIMPTSVLLSGSELYVGLGGLNAVAVIPADKATTHSGQSAIPMIPAGWYPTSVLSDGKYLYIASAKGTGARDTNPEKKGYNSHWSLGSITRVAIPDTGTLKQYTEQVLANARPAPTSRPAAQSLAVVPVPEFPGQKSVFKHVVYILKENRTYDQLFGDLDRGNRDADLCTFPRKVTPNHHALAEQFALLDNYYCNGVRSMDGHHWATAGVVTDYMEKGFGGFVRGGDEGYDAMQNSPGGFIWDKVLGAGLSFRNYGEFAQGTPRSRANWSTLYKDLQGGKTHQYDLRIDIDSLRAHTCPNYPGWNLAIPDVARAEIFLKEFRENQKSGTWANFVFIHLPQDHTAGITTGLPVPASMVADNDLALGRVVDAITHSRFWPDTCIFVVEDDPQSGYDHVDGHRSICLVISPYTRRGQTVSSFYNQTSVLRTMEAMLNLSPLTIFDESSPLMADCFTGTPDLRPYTVLPNQVPLDQLPPNKAAMSQAELRLARLSDQQDFSEPDRVTDDTMNRILWHTMHGESPYPAHLAGAHGKGLRQLKLELLAGKQEDDD